MTARNEREANGLMDPATDSELDRWLEAADRKKAKVDHQLLALVLGIGPLIGLILIGSIALIVRGCCA